MNKYFKKSTKRSVISILSIAITLCLLFSLLFPGKAVNAAPRMRLNKTAVTLIQGIMFFLFFLYIHLHLVKL